MPLKSIKLWLLQDMEARGLFPAEADEVFATRIRDHHMNASWEMDCELFSYQVKLTLRIAANHEVIEWMNATKPSHWAREHFE